MSPGIFRSHLVRADSRMSATKCTSNNLCASANREVTKNISFETKIGLVLPVLSCRFTKGLELKFSLDSDYQASVSVLTRAMRETTAINSNGNQSARVTSKLLRGFHRVPRSTTSEWTFYSLTWMSAKYIAHTLVTAVVPLLIF